MKERITYLIVIIGLIIALAFSAKTCNDKQTEISILNQNISALRDSTKKTLDLLGRVQYEKSIYLTTAETLKKLNKELYDELEANKKVRMLSKISTKIIFDTVKIGNRVDKINDSTFIVKFNYDKSYDTCNGYSLRGKVPVRIQHDSTSKTFVSSDTTTISDFNIRIKIITGINKEGDLYKIYARTDFPNVDFKLDGAIIDPDKPFITSSPKLFSLVLGAGLGVTQISSNINIVPTLGLYVGFNLINF